MNDKKIQNHIKIKINHPKLSQISFSFDRNSLLSEVVKTLSQGNILTLFNNYHYQQNGIPLKNTLLFIDSLNQVKDLVELDLVFQPYKYNTAMYHFQTLTQLLKQPPKLYSLLKTSLKQQRNSLELDAETLINELVPQCLRGGRWNIEEVINPSYCNQLWYNNKQFTNQLLQFMLLSGFNPPPSQAEFAGDLFYIHVKTLENYDCHITASPLGFYQNQSKINSYNPSSLHNKAPYPNLLDLLATLSDKFAQTMENNLSTPEKRVMQKISRKNEALLRNVNTRVTAWKWMNSWDQQHQWNARKAQSFIDLECSAQTLSDWNQQFLSLEKQAQNLKQVPTPHAELWKAQTYRQIYAPFAEAAISGARKIVQGRLLAINHMDQKRKHIFIKNNIFFSVTQDTPYDHRLQKGQDAIPSASSANVDLNNLQSLIHLPLSSLRLLHTVLINYQGFKIIGQTIIPGLLSSELSYLTQYGSIDQGKSIQVNPQFHELMLPVCKQLHLDDHVQAQQKNGNVVVIAVSPQIKGIRSIGGQYYLCDLQKLSPRDLNYQGIQNQACVLRQTLISNFIKDKKINFAEKPSINVNIGTQVKFKVSSKTQMQQQMLHSMARYLKQTAIVNLISALKSKNAGDYLTDSQGLSSIFHEYGVNLRYLGLVQQHNLLKDCLQVRFCLIRVILVRSLKHLFKMALRQTSCIHLNLVCSHLLNCILAKKHLLFQMNQREDNQDKPELVQPKKKKKKKNKEDQKEIKYINIQQTKVIKIEKSVYLTMKPQQVWEQVKKIAKGRFQYQFDNTIYQFIEKGLFSLPYQKFATLRDLCLSIGLILEKKDYSLRQSDKDNDLPFTPKNILSFHPIPKLANIHISSTLKLKKEEADQLFLNGNYGQALKAYQQVATLMRQKQEGEKLFSCCLGQISTIYYMMGNHRQAITIQCQNLAFSQRVAREDSLQVMRCYSRLGLYCMGLSQPKLALWLLYKSLYLMLISFGQVYPDVLINFANIARVHQLNKDVSMASSCYLKAIELLTQIYGGKCHVNISFCYSSLASLHYEQGQYRKSVDYQNEAVSIIQKVLSHQDSRLLDAVKILKVYKQMMLSSKNNKGIQHSGRFKK